MKQLEDADDCCEPQPEFSRRNNEVSLTIAASP